MDSVLMNESITVTAIADEDLKLEGQFGSIVRISRGETTEVRMKTTTKFERLMDYFYSRHYLIEGSLAFFFTQRLLPEQCPADVHMKMGDIIHIKNCLKNPKEPPEQKSTFVKDIKKMLIDSMLCDVTFIVGPERISAHRALLASRCDKFRAMFTGQMKESTTREITLEGPTPKCFKILLEYLYSDDVPNDIPLELYIELLQISDEYLLNNLVTLCESRLAKRVTVSTVPIILASADKYHATKLKEFCMGFILSNYSSVITSDFREHIRSPELLYEIMSAVAPYLPTHNECAKVTLINQHKKDLIDL